MELVLIVLFYPINAFDVFGLLSQWLNLLRWFSNGQFPGKDTSLIKTTVDFINFFSRLSSYSLSLHDFDSMKKAWKEFVAF